MALDPSAPAGQPAGVLASWLEQLFAQRLSGNAMRLHELGRAVRSEAFKADATALKAGLETCQGMTELLDSRSAQPGPWYLRISRTPPARHREFLSCASDLALCMKPLPDLAQSLQAAVEQSAAAMTRMALDLELELQDLDRLLPQAWSWHEQMWRDLKARRPPAGDTAARDKLRWLLDKCDRYARQLRQIDGASQAAREVVAGTRALLADRRAFLAATAKVVLPAVVKWRTALSSFVADLEAGRADSHGIKALGDRQVEVLSALEHGLVAGERAAATEQALREALGQLREILQSD